MKINTSHLVGAAIALAAVFFSKLDAQVTTAKSTQPKWSYDEVTFAKGTGPERYMKLINDFSKSEAAYELVTTHTDADGELHLIFRKPYVE